MNFKDNKCLWIVIIASIIVVFIVITIVFFLVFVYNAGPQTIADRHYFHTKEELQLTKENPRFEVKECPKDKPIAIFIYSAARSSGKYFEKRQSVRQTWVAEAKKEYGISSYFLVALNKNETVNQELAKEANAYNDMIQYNFIDNYWNLTLKNIATLRWVRSRCPQLMYMLKTDDDVIVNVKRLMNIINSFKSGFNSGFNGKKDKQKVSRETSYKWHIPQQYYSEEWLPEFVWGGAYVLTVDVIDKLIDTLDQYQGYVLDIDDVFVTGILAENAGVERHLNRELSFKNHCGTDDKNLCKMCGIVALVDCRSGQEVLDFYKTWRQYSCSDTCLNP